MATLKPAKIIQALALFDEKNSFDYGLALWATFHEVERFYAAAGAEVKYQRFYIAPSAPNPSLFESISQTLGRWIPGRMVQSALELPKDSQVRSSLAPSAELADNRRRTYDQDKLTAIIRKLVDPKESGDHLMIVTDRAITPPKEWRYIIWETNENTNSSVISVAPLDPEYWRDKDPQRILTIKNRTRNAALSVTGEQVGLDRCENPACFLFGDVDSVTVLDEMRELGEEHEISQLTGHGFEEVAKDPTLVQSITSQSLSKRGW